MVLSVPSDVRKYYQEEDEILPANEGEVLLATADCKGVPMVPSERSDQPKVPKASMFGKEIAFKELGDRLYQRDPNETKKIFILFDGERALEKRILKEFHHRGWDDRIAGIGLDIVHALEYLWEAGSAIYGEKGPERTFWVRRKGIALLEGKVGRVIGSLNPVGAPDSRSGLIN